MSFSTVSTVPGVACRRNTSACALGGGALCRRCDSNKENAWGAERLSMEFVGELPSHSSSLMVHQSMDAVSAEMDAFAQLVHSTEGFAPATASRMRWPPLESSHPKTPPLGYDGIVVEATTTQPPQRTGESEPTPASKSKSKSQHEHEFEQELPDLPITPGVGHAGRAPSFEALVEREIAHAPSPPSTHMSPSPRAFLRKGSGLKRFAKGPQPSPPKESPVATTTQGQRALLSRFLNTVTQKQDSFDTRSLRSVGPKKTAERQCVWEQKQRQEEEELDEFLLLEEAIVQKTGDDDDNDDNDDEQQDDPTSKIYSSTAYAPEETTRRSSSPPTSALVDRVFGGSGKGKKLAAHKGSPPSSSPSSSPPPLPLPPSSTQRKMAENPPRARQASPVDAGLDDVIAEKLKALDEEIAHFKSETEKVRKLKQEKEEELKSLTRERAGFEKEMSEAREAFERVRDEEWKKLRREKKLWERYSKAALTLPDRKERDEIERLKSEVSRLQQEEKKHDTRSKREVERLRKQAADIVKENRELKEELKFMEQERLRQWEHNDQQRTEVAPRYVHEPQPPSPVSSEQVSLSPSEGTSSCGGLQQSLPPTKMVSFPAAAAAAADDDDDDKEDGEDGEDENDEVPLQETRFPDGKVEKIYESGRKVVVFANKTRKEVVPGGYTNVFFSNGDVKQSFPDRRVVYYYAEARTLHTSFADGKEVFKFPSGQIEEHHPDGSKNITFPDKTIKHVFPTGEEETVFPDGTVQRSDTHGVHRIVQKGAVRRPGPSSSHWQGHHHTRYS